MIVRIDCQITLIVNLLFQTSSEDSSFLLLLAHQRIRGFSFMRYINPQLILIDTDTDTLGVG